MRANITSGLRQPVHPAQLSSLQSSLPSHRRPARLPILRQPLSVQASIADMSVPGRWHIETEAVHAGDHEHIAGAAITPIFQSATYLLDDDVKKGLGKVKYARCNNTPNHDVSITTQSGARPVLCKPTFIPCAHCNHDLALMVGWTRQCCICITLLVYARDANLDLQALAIKLAALESSEAAMVTSSGMAAISTAILTLLKTGDHMLVQQSLYGATEVLITNDMPEWGITSTRVDADRPDTWEAALKPNTKVTSCQQICWAACQQWHATIRSALQTFQHPPH